MQGQIERGAMALGNGESGPSLGGVQKGSMNPGAQFLGRVILSKMYKSHKFQKITLKTLIKRYKSDKKKLS